VPYKAGVKARDVLMSYGYDITFCDFEGNHTVPKEVLKQTLEWLKR